ncbi:hypothetical protein NA57DRAFT_65480 [Rhizodiscina lignyota]|uniref:F-box domain-containing protein n=1 Tax=Rhizodiscina lignyota TaxID=1504668 RepID=A0A9P4IEE3_9PEZI|nr:hypothetical protein NA57DRAFT_65480 [Rhizodiscina lignyota]
MIINDLPREILDNILEEAAVLNKEDGVSFTYGLSQAPMPFPQKAKTQKYVNGMLTPDVVRWDAATPLRQVCAYWHDWALGYSLKNLYLRRWRGGERWANLPQKQSQYRLYEIAEDRTGAYVYRDPFVGLRKTAAFLRKYPNVATNIRRLWLNGFHTVDTDADISSIIRSCTNLRYASLPSTVIRRLPASDLQRLLVSTTGNQLHSLELQAVDLNDKQREDRKNFMNLHPLATVDFSTLRRLKLIGDSATLPVTDADLLAIARTATNLEEFHITCLSTISIQGVMAIVEASQQTLRVLDHSPRSQDGFFHPHPGYLPSSEHHICDILASCPKLESLSISVPSMCASLFSNPNVHWYGDCQVRAAHLCNLPVKYSREASEAGLRSVLSTARGLITSHAKSIRPAELYIELFFADLIFEPGFSSVHGVFNTTYLPSGGQWPNERAPSRKGPYGSTGLYGKELEEEEEAFEQLNEEEFLRGVGAGWFKLEE